MNNTSLLRIAATAGTQLVKTRCTYRHYRYVYRILFDKSINSIFLEPFFQVTSSAAHGHWPIFLTAVLRLPWDFFIPNVVDQPFSASTKRILGLLSNYLNNYLSPRFFIFI